MSVGGSTPMRSMAPHHTASHLDGHLVRLAALAVGPVDDLVVDVGDVRDVADLEARPLEVAAEDVEHEGEPAVAEVGRAVDGGPAHVHRHLAGLAQLELADLAGGGVEQVEHPGSVGALVRRIGADSVGEGPIHASGPATAGTARSVPSYHYAASPPTVPDKPSLDGLEAAWAERWEDDGTYRFDRSRDPGRGLLHRHAAADGVRLAPRRPRLHLHPHRHHRPLPAHAGPEVFYPMGWDDNGLPTERRVQNYYGVRCDPSLPYDPRLRRPPEPPGKDQVPVSRRNFVELCERLTAEDEQAFEELWRRLGLSVDWSPPTTRPSTSAPGAPSQRAFLRNLARGEAYQHEAPDPVGRRLPDRRRPGRARGPRAARRLPPLAFHRTDGGGRRRHRDHPARAAWPRASPSSPTPTTSATSRCSAPRSARRCSASRCRSCAHPLADPEKGTGIAMICTFGDITDVIWWRELDLPDPGRRRPGRPRRWPTAPDVDHRRRRPRPLYARAGRHDRQAGPGPHRRAAARGGRAASASPGRSPTR